MCIVHNLPKEWKLTLSLVFPALEQNQYSTLHLQHSYSISSCWTHRPHERLTTNQPTKYVQRQRETPIEASHNKNTVPLRTSSRRNKTLSSPLSHQHVPNIITHVAFHEPKHGSTNDNKSESGMRRLQNGPATTTLRGTVVSDEESRRRRR